MLRYFDRCIFVFGTLVHIIGPINVCTHIEIKLTNLENMQNRMFNLT